ncbi:MAG: cadherin-like domain-containing protein [Bacteroidia bacterium]
MEILEDVMATGMEALLMKPGSGSTIMSYAGLCGTQNVATVTSPYFHTNSYEEITDYTRFGAGNNCATIINTGNNAPVVTVGTGGFVIPIETPFTLRGMATDPDNDTLTYCWEQYNLGQSGAPNTPVGNAPSFRSFPPVEIPERTFPQISIVVNGGTSNSEILPTYSRSFLFRLTARDNRVAGGGVDFEEIGFTATDQAGPFRVTHPNNGATWLAESWQTITWDPANTNLPPVNCFKVNVLLSTDGGFTYPITVASDLPNIGSATIKVPNVPGFGNRIRIEAADNIFFDITDENIDIIAAGAPGFAYFTQEVLKGDCAPNDITFSIVTSSLQGFSNMISLNTTNLPAGATASFTKNTISPNDTTQLTISNTGSVTPGIYHFQVIGTATSGETEILNLSVDIQNSVPNSVILGSPLNGASNLTILPTFFWVPFPGENQYLFEVATNPSFGSSTILSTLRDTNFYTFTTPLNLLTPYFWRVTASNVCGEGESSLTRAFQTTTQGTPPTVPEVITNLPLSVIQWQNEIISNSFLEVTDGTSSAGDLIYTLVSAPQNGFVELSNQAILVGETFTQNDINTGLVKYQHNGTNTSSDAFTFTIQNNNGGWFGAPTFQINITNTTSIADLAGFNINLT